MDDLDYPLMIVVSEYMKYYDLFNAVKCNIAELTTNSAYNPLVVSGVFDMYMHQGPCALRTRRTVSLNSDSVCSERWFA